MQFSSRVLAACCVAGSATLVACKSLGTPADQAEAQSLWSQMSDYRSWSQFEGHEGIVRGQGPHGKFVRTFVNQIGASSASNPAHGTIIVKENFSKDDEAALDSTTVMQRIAGYDPENNDWFWARYTPSGEQTHSGKVAFCSDCHFDASGDDLVFLND